MNDVIITLTFPSEEILEKNVKGRITVLLGNRAVIGLCHVGLGAGFRSYIRIRTMCRSRITASYRRVSAKIM